jgi:uncharacterized tellurite resistance protein B-like protein
MIGLVADDQTLADEIRGWLQTAFDAPAAAPAAPAIPAERELQIATAILCLSVARADHQCSQDEHRILARAVERVLGLGEDDTVRLMRAAEAQITASRSFADVVSLVDRAFSRERKCRILESLWRVAFADAELSGHEEYLVRKIADRLHLTTADLVETKIAAREAFGRDE